MMVVINMIMRTILSQPPMVQSKTLRTTCSLLKSSRTHWEAPPRIHEEGILCQNSCRWCPSHHCLCKY
jgi:hypothetical protein